MSFLKEKLRELKVKQFKIEYFESLLNLIGDSASKDLPEEEIEGQDQATKELVEFIKSRMEAIDSGDDEPETKQSVGRAFSDEEIQVLKALAQRAKGKTNSSTFSNTEEAPKASPKVETPGQKARKQDKIQFSLANRHLEGKKAIVTQNGKEITGVVVGLDSPFVIVKTSTGHTVPVDLDNLIME